MDIAPYLKRIDYQDTPRLDLPTLEALQWHHLFCVPFEDIDVHLKTPINLRVSDIFHKVVVNNRGGYCYELNALFAALLVHIGFEVSIISARVKNGNIFGKEYDHMALLVKIEGKEWLCDVGFGNFSLKPLLLKEGLAQNDGRDDYRIAEYGIVDGEVYLVVERYKASLKQFVPEYIFSLNRREVKDFEAMNVWQQTSPDSHFVQNFICSKPTKEGRISIINNHFIHTFQSSKTQRVISEEERKILLETLFGIAT